MHGAVGPGPPGQSLPRDERRIERGTAVIGVGRRAVLPHGHRSHRIRAIADEPDRRPVPPERRADLRGEIGEQRVVDHRCRHRVEQVRPQVVAGDPEVVQRGDEPRRGPIDAQFDLDRCPLVGDHGKPERSTLERRMSRSDPFVERRDDLGPHLRGEQLEAAPPDEVLSKPAADLLDPLGRLDDGSGEVEEHHGVGKLSEQRLGWSWGVDGHCEMFAQLPRSETAGCGE